MQHYTMTALKLRKSLSRQYLDERPSGNSKGRSRLNYPVAEKNFLASLLLPQPILHKILFLRDKITYFFIIKTFIS